MTTRTATRPDIESGVWTLDKNHTTIGFIAKHLMVTKVRGKFETYEVKVDVAEDPTESRIEAAIDVASLTTGVEDRDIHLHSADFFDVESHPTMRFISRGIELDGDEWMITGDLTIRDTTCPVTLSAIYEGTAVDPWGNTHVGFSARAKIDREDWGLSWNAAIEGGGWLVSKDVTIEIEGQLVRA